MIETREELREWFSQPENQHTSLLYIVKFDRPGGPSVQRRYLSLGWADDGFLDTVLRMMRDRRNRPTIEAHTQVDGDAYGDDG